jgi:hypothetical protein
LFQLQLIENSPLGKLRRDHEADGRRPRSAFSIVATFLGRKRTTTLKRMNNLPLGLLGRRLIQSDGDLTGSSVVNGCADEYNALVGTYGPLVHLVDSVWYGLAGKVGSAGVER